MYGFSHNYAEPVLRVPFQRQAKKDAALTVELDEAALATFLLEDELA